MHCTINISDQDIGRANDNSPQNNLQDVASKAALIAIWLCWTLFYDRWNNIPHYTQTKDMEEGLVSPH